ncbi:MAG: lamin tail domain-containing protein [Breznakibacter sp.]
MRWIFPFFLIAFHTANAQISEMFDDGEFLSSPVWSGTTQKFEVDANGRLRLKAPAETSDAWLFTSSVVSEEASWELDVEMQFDPSSQNYCRIYLMADAPEPAQTKNGFYLALGYTDDDISLYQLTDGIAKKLIDGQNGRLTMSTVSAKVKVTYSVGAGWELLSNLDGTWISEGISFYLNKIPSQWFGIYCKYTSTRSDKFYFDNIIVTGVRLQDRVKPFVVEAIPYTASRVMIRFSEAIDKSKTSPSMFTINPFERNPNEISPSQNGDTLFLRFEEPLDDDFSGSIQIASLSDMAGNIINDTTVQVNYFRFRHLNSYITSSNAIRLDFSKPINPLSLSAEKFLLDKGLVQPQSFNLRGESSIEISFDTPFANKTTNWLRVNGLTDLWGDSLRTFNVPLVYFIPERHDVVFSEIMPDPDPANELPLSEYVEIYNNTAFDVDLSGFSLLMSGKKYPITQGILRSGEHMALMGQNDTALWGGFDNMVAMKSFPALTNTAGKIILFSSQNIVMDAVNYDISWHHGNFKDDGGWSFERIDPTNFSGMDNWTYSIDLKGGTPGRPNSVRRENRDVIMPWVDFIEVTSDNSISLKFSEPIDRKTIHSLSDLHPNIVQADLDTLFCRDLTVRFENDFKERVVYNLEFPMGIADFAGNKLADYFPLSFAKLSVIGEGSLVINEVLFNPLSGGSDFIEIYNPSTGTYSLSDVYLARFIDHVPEKLLKITDYKIPVLPNSYWVVSDDVAQWQPYAKSPWWLFECPTMPTMPDAGGDIALLRKNGTVIDRLTYSEKWHYPLLNSKEGVSLERIDANAPTQSVSNWQSASSLENYSTPTYANSQSKSVNIEYNEKFTLSPQLFTPDGDGTDDYTVISFHDENAGGSATIKIFDNRGIEIITLANNELIGTSSWFKWDGTSGNGSRIGPGIYVVWCRIFFASGRVVEERKVCVLGVSAK